MKYVRWDLIPYGGVVLRAVEDGLPALQVGGRGVAVQQLQHAGAHARRHAQDDALRHALDAVALPVVRRVEQVVRGLLELEYESEF